MSKTNSLNKILVSDLGFSVTPSQPYRFQLEADTNDFVRRLRLKEYFHENMQNADKSLALSKHLPI